MDAWTDFSEPIDWLSAARSKQNSKKQVSCKTLQIFSTTPTDKLDVYAVRTS